MQDGEVRKQFERSLKKQGFAFKLNTKVWLCLEHVDCVIPVGVQRPKGCQKPLSKGT